MAKRARRGPSASTTDSGSESEELARSCISSKKPRQEASSLNKDDAQRSARVSEDNASATSTAAGPSTRSDEGMKTFKIFNMNVNGVLKAFARKEKRLDALLKEQDPDIVVLTEMHYDPQAPLKRKEDGMAPYQRFRSRYPYYHNGVNPGAPGRAGIAVYSKTKPLSIIKSGLPTFDNPASTKGRFIQFEYDDFYLVAVYSFHSGNSDKLDAHEVRKKWDAALRKYLHRLDKVKPVICVGDQNVAPTNDDVFKATGKLNHKPIQGCILQHEREAWFDLLKAREGSDESSFLDTWRAKHPDETKVFTHTSVDGTLNFFSGFRLDHFVISERLLPKVTSCEILSEETAMSDHIPIVLVLESSISSPA
ncbi:DNase I-like protein [Cystobasidium minutum MCA 4210]|uniref:DNase I-like protein n=1 Tax=Cystobasidium minutum MCA 4210 TaxID=1397322 RepID=UPI0034CE8205|eukprot:jgi/Rhomi1/209025/estExt_Genemark1.C_2_t20314